MFVHMPLYLRSIAGAPSNRALSGYPITAQHLCVKYHKPGEGVGGDFDHSSVSSVEMRQNTLTSHPPQNVPTNTDNTYQWTDHRILIVGLTNS